MTTRRARHNPPESEKAPLDPAVIKLVEALARAQAREDHERELLVETEAARR